ncbi:hypothetical protein D9M69_638080 [compost metagenome]
MGIISCKDGKGTRCLLKNGPEKCGQKREKSNGDHPVTGYPGIPGYPDNQQYQEKNKGQQNGEVISRKAQEGKIKDIYRTARYNFDRLKNDP